MVDERGRKLPSHPNFGLTPARMTRSKAAVKKQKTDGFYCDKCHNTLKTSAWLVIDDMMNKDLYLSNRWLEMHAY